MFERTVGYYRFINRPGSAEESKAFRIAVLTTVLLSVFAAVRYGGMGPAVGVPVALGVILGSYYSYLTRKRPNLLLKAILTVLLLVIFGIFWSDLSGSLYDLRYPLVQLFLWLQVLHSFNVPARRDLDFSLASATILVAFAGSLSLSTDFLYVLIPFSLAGLVSLYLGHRSRLEATSDKFIRSKGRPAWRTIALTSAFMLPFTLAFFVVLPRVPGFSSYYLPMSSIKDPPGAFQGFIKNPGYGNLPDKFPASPLPFNPNAYQGFSRFLDLRVRGVPSDVTVMKVRSPQPEYWRSTAFDRFLGNGWENTDKKKKEIAGSGLPLEVTYPGAEPRFATRELVQTFFIERKLPNTIFAAYEPRDVYFPTRVLKTDSMSTVVTPVILDPGLIYTIISEVSDVLPELLRNANGIRPKAINEQYLQLPPLPEAVGAIARQVTEGRTNDYDRVDAISEYLRTNFKYSLNIPRQGNDENTVEFFLREKRGYCEQFATTLAVMCRTLGIPSRLAVGYSTGQLNPLTGYYEVSARDAHAWVEVNFPVYGWISFDPTPGSSDLVGMSGQENTWSGLTLFNYIGRALSRVFPAGWGRALKGAASHVGAGIGTAARWVGSVVTKNWKGILVALALVMLVILIWFWRRNASRASPGERAGPPGPRERAVLLFERLIALLSKAGFPRRPSQTATEYVSEVAGGLGAMPIKGAADLFNRARFAREDPAQEDLTALEEIVDRAEAELSEKSSAGPHK